MRLIINHEISIYIAVILCHLLNGGFWEIKGGKRG